MPLHSRLACQVVSLRERLGSDGRRDGAATPPSRTLGWGHPSLCATAAGPEGGHGRLSRLQRGGMCVWGGGAGMTPGHPSCEKDRMEAYVSVSLFPEVPLFGAD